MSRVFIVDQTALTMLNVQFMTIMAPKSYGMWKCCVWYKPVCNELYLRINKSKRNVFLGVIVIMNNLPQHPYNVKYDKKNIFTGPTHKLLLK